MLSYNALINSFLLPITSPFVKFVATQQTPQLMSYPTQTGEMIASGSEVSNAATSPIEKP